VVFGLLLTVVGLAGSSGLIAYGLSGDRTFLDWAALWGMPWSIWVWPFNPFTESTFVGDAVASVLVNVLLVAAVLSWAWTKTRFGDVTASRSDAWVVGLLAGGSGLLVLLGTLGVAYYDVAYVGPLLAHPFLFGLVVIALMTIAMNILIPLRWLAGCAVGVGFLAAAMWGMVALVLLSLQDLDEFAPPISAIPEGISMENSP